MYNLLSHQSISFYDHREVIKQELLEMGTTMTPVQLDCSARDCDYKTQLLEYAQTKELLEIYVKVDHHTTLANGDSHRRPEKFPRPEISLEKSTEDWSEFTVM